MYVGISVENIIPVSKECDHFTGLVSFTQRCYIRNKEACLHFSYHTTAFCIFSKSNLSDVHLFYLQFLSWSNEKQKQSFRRHKHGGRLFDVK